MAAEINLKQFYKKSNKIVKLWKATLEKQKTKELNQKWEKPDKNDQEDNV